MSIAESHQRFMARRDLAFVSRERRQGTEWIVEDPLRREYFIFNWLEYEILRRAQRPISLGELFAELREIAPHSLTLEEVGRFIRRLVLDNLVVLERRGEGERLFRQETQQSTRRRLSALMNLISFRLVHFDPTRLLVSLSPLAFLFFNRVTLLLVFLGGLSTGGFALANLVSVWDKLPETAVILDFEHVLLALLAYVLVKSAHELGHGLACLRYGGSSSEMGILMLVFLPRLYVDVSDMWMQPSKFRRVMVSLAGLYVELAIAIVCFWLWYLSVPGLLNWLFLSLFTISSFNTVLINGNPLIKYDGYYVLSDWLEVPNLSTVSFQHLSEWWNRFLYKDSRSIAPAMSPGLIVFALASLLYRGLIFTAIVVAVFLFFDRWGLTAMGSIAAGVIALSLTAPAARRLTGWVGSLATGGKRILNWGFLVGLLLGLVYFLTVFEYASRIPGDARIVLQSPQLVFATSDGRLFPSVRAGTTIEAGDVVATIENRMLAEKLVARRGALREASQRLQGLQIQQRIGETNEAEVATLEIQVQSLNEEIAELEGQAAALTLSAQRSGLVLVPEAGAGSGGRLQGSGIDGWGDTTGGTPQEGFDWLDPQNEGCRVNRGDLICLIGDPRQLNGVVSVAESQIDLVKPGQEVKIYVPFHPDAARGIVTRIAAEQATAQDNEGAGQARYSVEFTFEANAFFRHGSITKVVILGTTTTPLKTLRRNLKAAFYF